MRKFCVAVLLLYGNLFRVSEAGEAGGRKGRRKSCANEDACNDP